MKVTFDYLDEFERGAKALRKKLVDFNFSYLEGRPFGAIRQNWLFTTARVLLGMI